MNDLHTTRHKPVSPCPARDDECTNLPEVKRLQEEIQRLSALVRTDELTKLFNFRYFNLA